LLAGLQKEQVVPPDDCVCALEALLSLRYLSTPLMAVLLREVGGLVLEAGALRCCLV